MLLYPALKSFFTQGPLKISICDTHIVSVLLSSLESWETEVQGMLIFNYQGHTVQFFIFCNLYAPSFSHLYFKFLFLIYLIKL